MSESATTTKGADVSETKEVKEAMERLRRVKSGEPLTIVYADHNGECVDTCDLTFTKGMADGDRFLLADAFLAANPADSDEAIDEAWIKSVAVLVASGDCWRDYAFAGAKLAITVRFIDPMKHCAMSIGWTVGDQPIVSAHSPKTRGQLRQLAAALSIPLAEGR